MKEKKNIDRLFQEKFKNFEAHPSDRVWKNIASTKQKKDNRKVIPLWWKVSGAAAALVLLFGLGFLLFNQDDTNKTQLVKNPTIIKDNTPENNIEVVTSRDSSNETFVSNQEQSNSLAQTASKISNSSQKINSTTGSQGQKVVATVKNQNAASNDNKEVYLTNDSEQNLILEQNSLNAITTNTNTSINTQEVAVDNPINDKKDLVATAQEIKSSQENQESIAQVNEESSINRWNVGAVAAPVYYGDFGGSGLDKQFSNNDKSGDVNLSYGVQVSYAITPKIKIRTGVSNVDLSYNTNEISFSTNGLGRRVRGVNYSDDAKTLTIKDEAGQNNFNPESIIPNIGISGNGSLQQQLSYLEIPVEAVFVLSDNRVGVSLIGGVSTLLLNDNDVILRSAELTTSLGTANGLNDVSFTTNIGLGLDYKVTKKVIFNIEPSLKYQLNSFDNTVVDFKPYYLGLYTGVSYKF
jgi:hypothetical protein